MENKKICSECQGKCCKRMGCHYSPEDFKEISYEALKAEIDKGHISIDWWEGNPFNPFTNNEEYSHIDRTYFLRTRNVNARIIDPSWGGVCSLLTENGCSLSYKNRPKGGRELIPVESELNCKENYSKRDCAKEWYKYNDILTKLYSHYTRRIRRSDVYMLRRYIKEEVCEFVEDIYDGATIMKNSKVQNGILSITDKEEIDNVVLKVTRKIVDIESEEKKIYNLVRDYISRTLNEEILKLLED